MKLLSTRKLNGAGFAHHFLLPVLAVLVVGGIGAYILKVSSAATASSYYTSTCINTTFGAPNSKFNQCVQDAQILLNAAQHHDAHNDLKLSVYGGSSFQYGPLVYLLMNGLYGKYTANAVTAATGNSAGQLTAGKTGTWQHLCSIAYSKGLNSDGSVLNFSSATGVTGGSVQYLKAPVSTAAAFKYDCGSGPVKAGASSSSSSSASTASSTACAKYTITTSSHGGAPAVCIYYVQAILNAAYQANTGSFASVSSHYDSYYKGSAGLIAGVSPTDNNYNNETKIKVMAFQGTFSGSNGANLAIDGATGPGTWGALCAVARSYKTNPKHYSWITAAQTAAKSGCGGTSGSVHQLSPAVLPGASSTPANPGGNAGCTSGCGTGCTTNCAPAGTNAAQLSQAESAYKDSTPYNSSTCTTMRSYTGNQSALPAAYPNCYNSSAQPSSTLCKNEVSQYNQILNSRNGANSGPAAAIGQQYPYCF